MMTGWEPFPKTLTGKKSDMSFKSVLYKSLLPSYRRWQHSGKMNQYWNDITNPPYDITIKLHGINATFPSDYVYPLVIRAIPTFNNPYIELVNQVFRLRKRKIVIADIGAAIGDTFLLLQGNIPEALEKIVCIEGSEKYFTYLEKNGREFPHCTSANIILSDTNGTVAELAPVHESSFSATGQQSANANTLDAVWETLEKNPPDIIKTDTDGFDGRILAGAKEILTIHQPAVIFEYHPLLIQKAGNRFAQVFEVLQAAGYVTLLWYNKKGQFSHIAAMNNTERIDTITRQCISAGEAEDLHYDVIALPASMHSIINGLEDCRFANNKKEPV